jgi:hypothetical protein
LIDAFFALFFIFILETSLKIDDNMGIRDFTSSLIFADFAE